MQNSTDDQVNNDAIDSTYERGLFGHVSDTMQNAVEVMISRASLAATEAKVAAISLVLVVVIALTAIVILSATWGLICYGLAYYLTAGVGLSKGISILSIIGLNLLILLGMGLAARSLIVDINLRSTLSPTTDTIAKVEVNE